MSDNGSKTMCIARIAQNIVPALATPNDATSCMDLQGTKAVSETGFLTDSTHFRQPKFYGLAAVTLWFVRMFKDTDKRRKGATDVFNLSFQPQSI